MPKATCAVVVLASLIGALLFACKSVPRAADPSAVFFPLKPNMRWMYRVESKSQRQSYVVTDMVLGEQYVPALKLSGSVVQEFYNLDRAGLRPIIYTQKSGYLTRLSGLDYIKHQIKGPAWGRSIDENFLPQRLGPNQTWENQLFPYGKLPGSFHVAQSHQSFFEARGVVVPAGTYSGCIRIETRASYEGGAYEQTGERLKLEYLDWYAPNVGLIKTIAYEGGPGGPEMERVELIRFDTGEKQASSKAGNSGPTRNN